MPHKPEEYNTWLRTDQCMPELNRFYWISDGKDIALAVWNIEDMCWKFKYMHSIVKPVYMMPVKLPKPEKEPDHDR